MRRGERDMGVFIFNSVILFVTINPNPLTRCFGLLDDIED